jgi:type 1 fimbria pilin
MTVVSLDTVNSNPFHGISLHVVVDVDVSLRDCNAVVPCQSSQRSHANALSDRICDEYAPA